MATALRPIYNSDGQHHYVPCTKVGCNQYVPRWEVRKAVPGEVTTSQPKTIVSIGKNWAKVLPPLAAYPVEATSQKPEVQATKSSKRDRAVWEFYRPYSRYFYR